MQYIKHYYVNESNGAFCCDTAEPASKVHPWRQYAGLNVKVWLTDAEGIDVCLAELPDSTAVSTVVSPCGKNAVQVLTEVEYQSVATPYFEAAVLSGEAQQAKQNGDDATAEAKETAAAAKLTEATTAIRAL
jgi:hypothetical protein